MSGTSESRGPPAAAASAAYASTAAADCANFACALRSELKLLCSTEISSCAAAAAN